jgi:hypothetical protein
MSLTFKLTCVSCYYPVKNKQGDNNKYLEWFKNTLSINCPYVFFTSKSQIDVIKQFRKDLPTYYIECEMEDFVTYPYRNKMISHPFHCPSVELNLIWNEKIFMIQKAYQINPFQTEWFIWMDAGLCTYRDSPPPGCAFPHPENTLLNKIPTDRFIYSASNPLIVEHIKPNMYYHYISGTYMIHSRIIDMFCYIYSAYLDNIVDGNNIWTDQVILTHIYREFPTLFYKLCDGYGEIARLLYKSDC